MAGQSGKLVLHIIPNTHWDREWYMSFESYRWRLVKLMDLLLDLMEEQQDYRSFTLDGQFLVVRDYLEMRPDKEPAIRKLVKDGRLLIGPWYTQPLETMVCGESLVRNLMLGIRESRKYGGVLGVNYTIDQFGHVSQMPQISLGFGLTDMMAWRGIPRGSRSTFKWEAPDGSAVLMHYSNGGYGEATALPIALDDYTEIIDDTPIRRQGLKSRIDGLLKLRVPKAITKHLLLLNGVDHSFAQSDLHSVIDEINAVIPGVDARHSSLEEYVEAVRRECENEGTVLGQYCGEMFDSSESEVLQPVHSVRAPQKIMNSRCEGLLVKWVEPFASFAWLLGKPYPYAGIWKAWEYNLQNHAHDSLGCASLDQVYRQVMQRYEWSHELGSEIVQESLQYLCNAVSPRSGDERTSEKALVVFNPLHFVRSEVLTLLVDIPAALGFKYPSIMEGDGILAADVKDFGDATSLRYNPRRGHPTIIPVRRFEITFMAAGVPALGYKAYRIVDSGKPVFFAGSLLRSHSTAENEHIRLTVNPNGTFDLTDKGTGKAYPGLHFFQDAGEAGSGYERREPPRDKVILSTGAQGEVSIVEDTPLKVVFRVETVLDLPAEISEDRSTRVERTVPCRITSLITIAAATPRVDIVTTVENRAKDHRLKVVFPTYIDTNRCWVEQPFDVVERSVEVPDLNEYPNEKPVPEHPQQLFTDVNDGHAGLMIANEGIYEYEVKDDSEKSIALTLLRCVDRIDMGTLGRMEEMRIPEAQCLGTSVFRYSLIPHEGGWQNGLDGALSFRFPMRAVMRKAAEEEVLPEYSRSHVPANAGAVLASMPPMQSFIEVAPKGLEVSAVKRHEDRDSLVIRLLNRTDEALKGRLKVNLPGLACKRAYSTNLNEEAREGLIVNTDGYVEVNVGAKRIFTIEIPVKG